MPHTFPSKKHGVLAAHPGEGLVVVTGPERAAAQVDVVTGGAFRHGEESGRSARRARDAVIAAGRPCRSRLPSPPSATTDATFDALQDRLGPALALSQPGRTDEHVIVALPSFSLGESLLSHYGDRIPALEHRYLLALLVLNRIACDVVLVVSQAPGPEVLDYYFSLIPEERRASARARLHVLEVPDPSHRSIAEKLLDRPDLIERLRTLIGGRPAFIEPWNVTDHEVAVALALDVPINGSAPRLWPLGLQERRSPPVQGGRGAGGRSVARTCARSTTSSRPSRRCGRLGHTWRAS